MTGALPPADATAHRLGWNGLMKRITIASCTLVAAMTTIALTGCADLEDVMQKESSAEFDTAAEVAADWDTTVPWLPDDATGIRIHQSTAGEPAVLLTTSEAALDASRCVQTERRSAPAFSEDWSPDAYVDTVFACGDWAVIPTDTGWYGWTPNHPDEKAASLQSSPE
jgi:hypothetical protein